MRVFDKLWTTTSETPPQFSILAPSLKSSVITINSLGLDEVQGSTETKADLENQQRFWRSLFNLEVRLRTRMNELGAGTLGLSLV